MQGRKKGVDAVEEAVVDYTLVLVRFDLVLALRALLMNLISFGSNEGWLVDIWVHFDIRVVTEL